MLMSIMSIVAKNGALVLSISDNIEANRIVPLGCLPTDPRLLTGMFFFCLESGRKKSCFAVNS